jgi:hypothetical protein
MDEPNDNKKKHPNWGGRRPGAGAPKGNLNGLKHGRYSRQQALIVQALADIPEARDALINIAKRNRIRRKQAEEGGGIMLVTLLENAAALALTPSPGPPVADIPLPEGEGHLSSPLPASGEGPGVRDGLSSPLPASGEGPGGRGRSWPHQSRFSDLPQRGHCRN